MWRPGMKLAAALTMIGWLAGPPVKALQDEGINRGPSKLEMVTASGPELGPSPGPDAPSLRLANLPGVEPTPGTAIRSRPQVSNLRTASRPAVLIGLYVSYGLLQALDGESTIHALQAGKAQEGNPILRPFASNPAALATFKLGLTGGTIFGIDRLRKSHRRLALAAMAGVNGAYVGIVLRNYRNFSSH